MGIHRNQIFLRFRQSHHLNLSSLTPANEVFLGSRAFTSPTLVALY